MNKSFLEKFLVFLILTLLITIPLSAFNINFWTIIDVSYLMLLGISLLYFIAMLHEPEQPLATWVKRSFIIGALYTILIFPISVPGGPGIFFNPGLFIYRFSVYYLLIYIFPDKIIIYSLPFWAIGASIINGMIMSFLFKIFYKNKSQIKNLAETSSITNSSTT